MLIIDNYFKKPGVSNSFLGCVKSGTAFKCSEETLSFGTQVHESILEPEVYAAKIKEDKQYIAEAHKVYNMTKSAKANPLLAIFLSNPATEYEGEHFFTTQGVDCKLKADLKLGKLIGDIKTTDATTREEFEARAFEYGYNRQGAFYLDGTDSDKFIFFAISKKYPYHTFTYVLAKDDPKIIAGREEYITLIDIYKTLTPEQIKALKQ